MLERARNYFAQQGVLEVDTPILSRAAVSDPNIESISARLRLEPESDCFLQTSPEYHMKRLLCAGYPDIYEICKVFRDGESGRHHAPEFTMVEWYRLGFGLQGIIDDTLAFISAVLEPDVLTGVPLCLDYRDAILRATGVDPVSALRSE